MLLSSLNAAVNYDHIYVAPHLDDAVLSCGGRIARQVDGGQRVLAVTLCAGSPPHDAVLSPFAQYLHREWALGDDPMALRREEDALALAILGCDGLHLDQLDAPYREAAYGIGDGWRGHVVPDDRLIAAADAILTRLYDQQRSATFYVPLGVGNHVDHQIVCDAGRALHARGAHVVWYEDAPYAAKAPQAINQRIAALSLALSPELIDITPTLARKLAAINHYRSQLRELFGDADMAQVMTTYAARVAGDGGLAERVWGL